MKNWINIIIYFNKRLIYRRSDGVLYLAFGDTIGRSTSLFDGRGGSNRWGGDSIPLDIRCSTAFLLIYLLTRKFLVATSWAFILLLHHNHHEVSLIGPIPHTAYHGPLYFLLLTTALHRTRPHNLTMPSLTQFLNFTTFVLI